MSLVDSQSTFIDFVKHHNHSHSELERVHESKHDTTMHRISWRHTHGMSSAFLIFFLRGALYFFLRADFS